MAARNVTFADDAIFHSDRGSNLGLQRKYSEVLWCAGDGVGLAGCDTPGGMRDQRRVIHICCAP